MRLLEHDLGESSGIRRITKSENLESANTTIMLGSERAAPRQLARWCVHRARIDYGTEAVDRIIRGRIRSCEPGSCGLVPRPRPRQVQERVWLKLGTSEGRHLLLLV